MKLLRHLAIVVLLLAPAAAFPGEVIDGVIATVSRKPVLQSEWDDATRFEAFMQQKPLTAVTDKDRVDVLQRLVDRRLLEAQMNSPNFLAPSGDELRANLSKLRAQIPAAKDDKGWQAVLAAYGFSEREVEDHLRGTNADDELRRGSLAPYHSRSAGRSGSVLPGADPAGSAKSGSEDGDVAGSGAEDSRIARSATHGPVAGRMAA